MMQMIAMRKSNLVCRIRSNFSSDLISIFSADCVRICTIPLRYSVVMMIETNFKSISRPLILNSQIQACLGENVFLWNKLSANATNIHYTVPMVDVHFFSCVLSMLLLLLLLLLNFCSCLLFKHSSHKI